MNKEDYVSLEVAKMLKEKGANLNGKKLFLAEYKYRNNGNVAFENEIEIPTLYEAAKWLRNEHDINVAVATAIPAWINRIPDNSDTLYTPFIAYKKDDGETEMAILRNLTDFNYEKVYNDAILKALKLI